MTLQSSGIISASDINVELDRTSSALFTTGNLTERELAEVLSGTIKFSDFYGKSLIFSAGSVSIYRDNLYSLILPTGVIYSDGPTPNAWFFGYETDTEDSENLAVKAFMIQYDGTILTKKYLDGIIMSAFAGFPRSISSAYDPISDYMFISGGGGQFARISCSTGAIINGRKVSTGNAETPESVHPPLILDNKIIVCVDEFPEERPFYYILNKDLSVGSKVCSFLGNNGAGEDQHTFPTSPVADLSSGTDRFACAHIQHKGGGSKFGITRIGGGGTFEPTWMSVNASNNIVIQERDTYGTDSTTLVINEGYTFKNNTGHYYFVYKVTDTDDYIVILKFNSSKVYMSNKIFKNIYTSTGGGRLGVYNSFDPSTNRLAVVLTDFTDTKISILDIDAGTVVATRKITYDWDAVDDAESTPRGFHIVNYNARIDKFTYSETTSKETELTTYYTSAFTFDTSGNSIKPTLPYGITSVASTTAAWAASTDFSVTSLTTSTMSAFNNNPSVDDALTSTLSNQTVTVTGF